MRLTPSSSAEQDVPSHFSRLLGATKKKPLPWYPMLSPSQLRDGAPELSFVGTQIIPSFGGKTGGNFETRRFMLKKNVII